MKKTMDILKMAMTHVVGMMSILITIWIVYFWGDVVYTNLFTNSYYQNSFLEWAMLATMTWYAIDKMADYLLWVITNVKNWIRSKKAKAL